MSDRQKLPAHGGSSAGQVADFIARLKTAPAPFRGGRRGRLMFALDATASRQPTWDQACRIQAEMFEETAKLGGLEIQLVWFRGFGEFSAAPWIAESRQLIGRMTGVSCRGGHTQIGRLLDHALAEAGRTKIDALVFVGDCLEEPIDPLCAKAGQLGLLGVPMFLFHEGRDAGAESGFRELARLTRGAYCPFDASAPQQLRDLLKAVALYAAGGRAALLDYARARGGVTLALTDQVR